jgi:CRP-like cAMP-binding protein
MSLWRRTNHILVPDSPLFAGCTRPEKRALNQLGTRVVVDAGTMLTPEGQPGREFFVVEGGEASCSVRGVPRAKFARGDFFGEMALLDGGPRTATVMAETPMELVVFGTGEFHAMLDTSPGVRHRLLVEMSRRLRAADAAA